MPTPSIPTAPIRRPVDGAAVLTAVVLCFIWGLQQVAIKAAGLEVTPMMQVSIRSGVAAALVLLWNRYVLKETWNTVVKPFHGFLTGLGFTGEFLFVAEGLRFTSASHMAVLLYTAPLFAAVILAVKLPEERLSKVQWAGVACAFIGIVTAFGVPALMNSADSGLPEEWILGDVLGLLGGLSWGLTTVAIRTTTMNHAVSSQMLFWQLAVAFAILFPLGLLTGENKFEPELIGWSSLIFQTLIVSFGSYLVWCGMLRKYLAARLGVLAFMTPLFGVAMGVVLLGESIDVWFVIGAVLVLLGLVTVQGSGVLKSAVKRRS